MADIPDDITQLRSSRLFDADWYQARYGDVAGSGLEPAEHYLKIGAALGRDPGPGFSTRAYQAACRAAGYAETALGINPLVHFETTGRKAGLQPRPSQPVKPDFGLDAKTTVDVLVPVFNALADTQTCLTALAETAQTAQVARADLRVLVIDDGSDPETAQWLDQACAGLGRSGIRFALIRHPENRGYTQAINTGLAQVDADFVITLNSDTIVTPGWINGLLRCFNSDPGIGIAGPLSNAASWQNVPKLWDEAGGFAINTLPDDMTPADMALRLRRITPRPCYPRTPFVNGFCMAMRRAVIDMIGLLDTDNFAAGYGEENDYCIRALDAGFALAFAEDVYVHHAKSKSFGDQRRQALSQAGHTALCTKHGADRVAELLGKAAEMAETGAMAQLRARLQRSQAEEAQTGSDTAQSWLLAQRILFLLPVGAGGGGAHSVIQEVSAMRAMGVMARVAVGDFAYREFLATYRDIPEIDSVLLPYHPDDLTRLAQDYDVLVATLYSTVAGLAELVASNPHILPAYYVQDYEPLFFAPGSPEHTEAEASYTLLPQMRLFAKTDWICDEIQTRHGVRVAKVSPSLDHDVYFPAPHVPAGRAVHFCAMIRPGTTRRGAARTMAFLKRLYARHEGAVAITIFGCAAGDPAMEWLDCDFAFENAGILTRPQVAELLRRSDIFVDLSDYQAFGRTSLEAMACGALPLLPHLGGGDEYALDGVNALVCDTQNLDQCLTRVSEMLADKARLHRMRLQAIATAARYSTRRAAMSELLVLAEALAQHRKEGPDPAMAEADQPMPSPAIRQPRRGPLPAFADQALASGAFSLPVGQTPLPVAKPDIGVHLHLHYPDLTEEIARYLAHIPMPFALYVSTPEATADNVQQRLSRHLPNARLNVQSFANRGRDIGPWLAGFGRQMQAHDLICHIHSKASPHNAAKADWRDQLLNGVLGSPAGITAIWQLFDQTPHLGLVFPAYHSSLVDQIGWGTNFPAAQALADRMNVPLTASALAPFPAGSMFWARPAALAPLFELGLSFEDFPKEARQIDGTPAHAIERLLGEVVLASGHSLIQVYPEGDDATA